MGCIVCQRLEQRVLRQLNKVVTQQARYGYQGSEHNAHIDHGVTMWHRLHLAPCTLPTTFAVMRLVFALLFVWTELKLPFFKVLGNSYRISYCCHAYCTIALLLNHKSIGCK